MRQFINKISQISVMFLTIILFILFGCEKDDAIEITPIASFQIRLIPNNSKLDYPDQFLAKIDVEIVDGIVKSDSVEFVRNNNVHRSSGNIEVPLNKRFVLKVYAEIGENHLYDISDTLVLTTDPDEAMIVKMSLTTGNIIISSPEFSLISTTTAVLSATIYDDGGEEITAKGFMISENGATTTTGGLISVSGSEIGEFEVPVDGLLLGTTYYVTAYATNAEGTVNSEQRNFTTLNTTGVVNIETYPPTNISANSATISAAFIDDGGETFVEKGFIWATFTNPDLTNNEGITYQGAGNFAYDTTITGVFESTQYYVKAYGTTDEGDTYYGNEIAFTTMAFIPPVVETSTISDIFLHTTVFTGIVTDEGNMTVDSKGVVYNTTGGATIETNIGMTDVGAGGGEFTTQISGLESGVQYYARAYAASEAGVCYGAEIPFTTLSIGSNGPAGGIVFYDDGVSGGLEVTVDSYEVSMQWGCGSLETSATDASVGGGFDNTSVITTFHDGLVDYEGNPTQCDASNDGTIAAKYCSDFDLNSYSDWFLPSQDELMLIYSNLHAVGLGNFTEDIYWTSTEVSDIRAKAIDFWKGSELDGVKTATYKLRPVRKF